MGAIIKKRQWIFFVVIAMIGIPFYNNCFAEESNPGEDASAGNKIFDSLLLRPLGIASIAIGMGIFVVSLPFTAAIQGNIRKTFDVLVVEPAIFAFKRPLGKF